MAEGIIAGYTRVSTEDQAYQVALENHIKRLRDSGCDRVYADIASRADNEREGLDKLFTDIKNNAIKEVRLPSLSRLTSSAGLFEEFGKILSDHDVTLRSLDENINIDNVDGEFFAGMLVQMSKFELNTIRKRSQRGHQSKRANHRPNSNAPWGYIVEDRQYKIDTTPFLCLIETGKEMAIADIAKDIIEILSEVGSLSGAVRVIHQKYGVYRFTPPRKKSKARTSFVVDDDTDFTKLRTVKDSNKNKFRWTHDSLAVWIRNPILRGHTAYNTRVKKGKDSAGRLIYGQRRPRDQWDIVRDTHPDQVLLTEMEYQHIEQQIKRNSETWAVHLLSGKAKRYPLSGLIYCSECNGKMKSQASKLLSDGKRYSYYKCKGAIAGTCNASTTARYDRIEEQMLGFLAKEAERIASIPLDKSLPPEPDNLQELRQQLAGLNALGENPAFDTAKKDLSLQIEILEREWKAKNIHSAAKREDVIQALQEPDFWDIWTEEDKIKLYPWLIKAVWIREGQVERVDFDF